VSCQFNVSFVGAASIAFFRDLGKLWSVVDFECHFTLVHGAPDIHYYF